MMRKKVLEILSKVVSVCHDSIYTCLGHDHLTHLPQTSADVPDADPSGSIILTSYKNREHNSNENF